MIEAVNWTAAVNRLLRSSLTPQQVADLPEETLWVIDAMLERLASG